MPESVLRCTVVVVNYNGRDFILECLDALLDQRTDGLQVEIVVVDNASADGSPSLIEQRPAVRLIRSATNRGFAGGVNLAISATAGDLVVLVNSDAVAAPGFLQAITAPFRSGPAHLAAVTGRIVLSGRFVAAPGAPDAYVAADGRRWVRLPADAPAATGIELMNSTGSQMSRSGNGRDRSWLTPVGGPAPPPDVFGFCGGAAALRREALVEVGSFDERLFLYYEDTDLSWRLRRWGWTIRYTPDATVRHQHAASSGIGSQVFLRYNIRNRVLVAARNGPSAMFRSALLHTVGHLLLTLPKALSRRNGRRARTESAASLWALGQLAVLLPAYLTDGRRCDRAARLPRDFVYAWSVQDGVVQTTTAGHVDQPEIPPGP